MTAKGPSVDEIMRTDVFTLDPTVLVNDARILMQRQGIDYIVVVEREMLAGILSKEDLAACADQRSQIRNCMTSPVPCVGPETSIQDAAEIMEMHGFSCLAVVLGALLVGVISRNSLLAKGFIRHCEACSSTRGVVSGPNGLLLCETCQSKLKTSTSTSPIKA